MHVFDSCLSSSQAFQQLYLLALTLKQKVSFTAPIEGFVLEFMQLLCATKFNWNDLMIFPGVSGFFCGLFCIKPKDDKSRNTWFDRWHRFPLAINGFVFYSVCVSRRPLPQGRAGFFFILTDFPNPWGVVKENHQRGLVSMFPRIPEWPTPPGGWGNDWLVFGERKQPLGVGKQHGSIRAILVNMNLVCVVLVWEIPCVSHPATPPPTQAVGRLAASSTTSASVPMTGTAGRRLLEPKSCRVGPGPARGYK